MKKTAMIFLSSALMLAACSATDVEEKSKEILEKSLTSEEVLKNEVTSKNEDLEKAILDSLGIENQEVTIDNSTKYEELQTKIQDLKQKTKLTVKNVSFENNKTKAEALVDLEFYDIGATVAQSVTTSLENNLVKMYSGSTISEGEVHNSTIDLILESLDSDEIKKKTAENVKVELVKKEGVWEIKNMSDSLMSALTLNISETQESIKKKAKEVKENRVFLEVETNLRSIHSEVSNAVKEKAIKLEDLKKTDSLKEKLSQLTSETVSFPGEEKGLYHVTYDKDKKELVVEHTKKEETMKLSLPVQ